MKNKVLFLLTLALISGVAVIAQLNVGSTGAADPSAILQATSTTKGFLPPVMTTTQINAIVSPANGLTIYNSTLSQLQVNVGTPVVPSWSVAAGGANVYWSQQGNTGTVPGTNYIGTTDNNSLGFRTNGVERVRIDSSTGNVGIGLINPSAPLQFANILTNKKIVLWDNFINAGNDSSFLGFGVNGSTLRYQVPTGSQHSFYVNKTQVASIASSGTIFSMGSIPGFGFYDRARTSIVNSLYSNNGVIRLWGSQNGDLLTVDSVGNGTIKNSLIVSNNSFNINALPKLDVNGSGLFRNGTTSINYGGNQLQFGYMGDSIYRHRIATRHNSGGLSNNAMDFYVWNYGVDGAYTPGTKQVMTLDGTGFVGIGTTTPATKLQAVSFDNVGNTSIIDAEANNMSVGTAISFDGLQKSGSNANSNLYLDGKGTGGIFLNGKIGTGNVGVGTAGPAYKLDVVASSNVAAIRIGDGGSGGGIIFGNANHGVQRGYPTLGADNNVGLFTTGGNIYLANNVGATNHFVLTGGGAVGIGTGNPSYNLDVNGSFRCTAVANASSFNTTSDLRLKKNLIPLNNALSKIMQLMPYSYEKKDSLRATKYNQKEMGFIAQDIRKLFPDLVAEGTDKDKTLSVNYTALIPVLTKAIQEQQAQNDSQVAITKAQATEIALLKKEILSFASEIADIKDLKIAMLQLRNELNKTTVTQVVVPKKESVNN